MDKDSLGVHPNSVTGRSHRCLVKERLHGNRNMELIYIGR
jgi:hypothetical protein